MRIIFDFFLLLKIVTILFISLQVSCGKPCEGVECTYGEPSPTPTPPPPANGDEFLLNPPKTWGVLRQFNQCVVSGSDCVEQTVQIYILAKWEEFNGGYRQVEEVCSVSNSMLYMDWTVVGAVQQTIIPRKVIENVPLDTWYVSLSSDVSTSENIVFDLTSEYYGDLMYTVWGAEMVQPKFDKCSSNPEDSSQIDSDKDGHPGITTELWMDVNPENSESPALEAYLYSYICQRMNFSQDSSVVGKPTGSDFYWIQGRIKDVVVDQTMYGYEYAEGKEPPLGDVMEGVDPEVNWSDNDGTYFIQVSVPSTATCDNINSELFSLL